MLFSSSLFVVIGSMHSSKRALILFLVFLGVIFHVDKASSLSLNLSWSNTALIVETDWEHSSMCCIIDVKLYGVMIVIVWFSRLSSRFAL